MVDCKINPNAVRTKRPASFKMVFTTNPFLGTDLLSSIAYSERIKIETFCELGLSNIQMADRLNRSPATIFYELSRCQPYQAKLAQADAEYRRARCGRKTKLNAKLKQTILNHLRLSWSPEVIAHELKLATKSIYNWLNQGQIEFPLSELPEHGLRQRRNLDQRSKYNQSLGQSIEQRPSVINQRKRIGDFEMDTIVGPRGHSKAVLSTLLDRKSRFLWAYRLKDRTVATVNEALTKFLMSAGTKEKVIALFDNDYEGIKQIKKIKTYPNNFVIDHYPDRPFARHYQVENNGKTLQKNINGRGLFLELYIAENICSKQMPELICKQSNGIEKYHLKNKEDKDALKIRYDKLLSDDQILKNKVGVNAIIWYVLEKSMNCKY